MLPLPKKDNFHLSHYYYFNNQLDSAYLIISKLLEKGGSSNEELFILHSLKGQIFNLKRLDNQAIAHIRKAIVNGEKTNRLGVTKLYPILAQLYINTEKHYKAIALLEKWKTSNLDTLSGFVESDNFINLGIAYLHVKNYDKSKNNLFKGLEIDIKNKDPSKLTSSYLEIANLYYDQNKDSIAKSYFDNALKHAVKSDNLDQLENFYLNMSIVEENENNLNLALAYRKNYDTIRSTIWNRDSIWELSQKDKAITRAIDLEKLRIEQKQKRRYLHFLLFFLLVIIGIGYLSMKLKYQNKIIVKQKNNLQALNNFKNELFSVLGHDLRAPMHQILTINGQLTKSFQNNESQKVKTLLKHSKSTVTNTYLLLDNLLYWIRLQSNHFVLKKEQHDIYALINQTISIFNVIIADKAIDLNVQSKIFFNVRTDAIIFKILFRNLLDNALKFTPNHGNIIVKCIENKYRIVIIIKDNGLGIDKEQLANINDYNAVEASTVDASGKRSTGFGIRICKSYVKKLGGSLKILSAKDIGTTSIISILK